MSKVQGPRSKARLRLWTLDFGPWTVCGRRLIMKAWQRIAGFDLPRRNELRNLQHPHAPRLLGRIDVAYGRIRRPQVDADDIAAGMLVKICMKFDRHGDLSHRWPVH